MAENSIVEQQNDPEPAIQKRFRSGDLAKMKRQPPISYGETIVHLFKGNLGPGCYAMAEAIKNCGIILGPLLTMLIAFICVHVQHILIACAKEMQEMYQMKDKPDYAQTVEMCFVSNERCRKSAGVAKAFCNVFICITQLGFCSVYFLFCGTHIKDVLSYYGYNYSINMLVAIILIPILFTSMNPVRCSTSFTTRTQLLLTIFLICKVVIEVLKLCFSI